MKNLLAPSRFLIPAYGFIVTLRVVGSLEYTRECRRERAGKLVKGRAAKYTVVVDTTPSIDRLWCMAHVGS